MLAYDWQLSGRPEQFMPDGDWFTWLILTGRGFGKTRAGVEAVRHMAESGKAKRIALVGATAADTRDVIVEGESGILEVCPPWNRPHHEPSKRRLTWPNGARAYLYSADEPGRLRGPQHDFAFCDEVATWRRPEAWDNLLLGLRLGSSPRVVVATTPKPRRFLELIVSDPGTHVTAGSTYDNAENLPAAFFDQVVQRYEGTSMGQQELYGRMLREMPGALLRRGEHIDALRVLRAPPMVRVIVAIDPSATAGPDSDEAGVMVAGRGEDDHLYVLRDLSAVMGPTAWGMRSLHAADEWGADAIVAETNQGGDMVEAVMGQCARDAGLPMPRYIRVHAKRGKHLRAEPVVALYEQGRVHHVGEHQDLEDQLVSWTPDADWSPDRMDALVYALTELAYPGGVQEIWIGSA